MHFIGAVDILLDLRLPELPIALRQLASFAGVSMPEAAVDEQSNAVLWQHEIGSTRPVFAIKWRTVSKPVEE